MLAYRDAARVRATAALKAELLLATRRLDQVASADCALEVLLRAGELECALADAGLPSTRLVAQLSDAAAASVVAESRAPERARCAALCLELERRELPERLTLKTPEGYAYYGLDPRAYARMADRVELGCRKLAVIARAWNTC